MICKICKYWENENHDSFIGKCHRNPPTVISRNESFFPKTEETDWCEEGKDKEV